MDNPLPKRFADKVYFGESCWLWKANNFRGYGRFHFNKRMVKAHRFSWEHFNGPIPDGLNVLHKCDVPGCVNPSHLFLGTAQDNVTDMISKGRENHPRGDRHGSKTKPDSVRRGEQIASSKLSERDVEDIRRIYKRGVVGEFSLRGLGKKYGATRQHISYIVSEKRWKKINGR